MSEPYFWPMFLCRTQIHPPADLSGTNTNLVIVILSSAEIDKYCLKKISHVNTLQLFSLYQFVVKHYVVVTQNVIITLFCN